MPCIYFFWLELSEKGSVVERSCSDHKELVSSNHHQPLIEGVLSAPW
jgi:hypothetical protein